MTEKFSTHAESEFSSNTSMIKESHIIKQKETKIHELLNYNEMPVYPAKYNRNN
jgi:hypothetical protein